MSKQEQKTYIKQQFKNYRKMTASLQRNLKTVGITVVDGKNHLKLYFNGKLYTCPKSASDHRSGPNMAALLCRAI